MKRIGGPRGAEGDNSGAFGNALAKNTGPRDGKPPSGGAILKVEPKRSTKSTLLL